VEALPRWHSRPRQVRAVGPRARGRTRKMCRTQVVVVAGPTRRGSEPSSLWNRKTRCSLSLKNWVGGFRSTTRVSCRSSVPKLVFRVTSSRFGCITTSTPLVRSPRTNINQHPRLSLSFSLYVLPFPSLSLYIYIYIYVCSYISSYHHNHHSKLEAQR